MKLQVSARDKPKRIVVKLGTSTLSDGTPYLFQPRMVDLVRQMSDLMKEDIEILLVSSGAISYGRELLQFPHLPKDIPAKQMLAAVGQPRLMDLWGKLFALYGFTISQVLLTRDDLRYRSRYLNSRNTLLALLKQGVLPVINENDTVATEEIRVGDNDNLSALVANIVDADALILLTDQDGLFNADPRSNPNAQLIKLVDGPEIDQGFWNAAGGSGSLGVGGMITKLQSADLARRSGTSVVIANGSLENVLLRIVNNEEIGTRFTPIMSAVESRKRFILSGVRAGKLVVDEGAVRALSQGGSLLPVGMIKVTGEYSRGDTLSVCTADGREVARGLVNYDCIDCQKLCGCQSSEIENVLGYFYGEEIIHRNNMVLL